MKPFVFLDRFVCLALVCCCLLILIPAGCKNPASLVGTYSIEDNGKLRLFIRVEQQGDKYFFSIRDRWKWLTPVEAAPVDGDDLEQLIGQPVEGRFVALGNENVAVVQVAKGWRLGPFECRTGYWLASQMGPMELHKE